MACLKQATAKRHLPQVRDMNLRHAERLIGTGLRLLEAMERRQDKKPSTAMVGAFLNVQPGGQAIVGMQVGLNQVDAEIDPSATVQRHHPAETRGTEQGSPFVAQDERLKRPPGAPPKGAPAVADNPRNTGPMRHSPRCGATTRVGTSCQAPAVHGKRRCGMHGGAATLLRPSAIQSRTPGRR
jgi:hypothetical protein